LATPHNQPYINLWDAKRYPGRTSGPTNEDVATATTKTVYDPCPAGFCVPTSNLWSYLRASGRKSGYTFDETNVGLKYTDNTSELFFPLMGRRVNCDVDPIESHSKVVFYWSSSGTLSSGIYGAEILAMQINLKDIPYNAQCYYGYPIRAVAE
jgi:hypothetical protein